MPKLRMVAPVCIGRPILGKVMFGSLTRKPPSAHPAACGAMGHCGHPTRLCKVRRPRQPALHICLTNHTAHIVNLTPPYQAVYGWCTGCVRPVTQQLALFYRR